MLLQGALLGGEVTGGRAEPLGGEGHPGEGDDDRDDAEDRHDGADEVAQREAGRSDTAADLQGGATSLLVVEPCGGRAVLVSDLHLLTLRFRLDERPAQRLGVAVDPAETRTRVEEAQVAAELSGLGAFDSHA